MVELRQLLYPLYRGLETAVHPLRYLFLEITQQCNLSCLHCGSDCGKAPLENQLTTEEWLAFIAELAERFPGRNKPFLVITGGEPLLHPQLDELLSAIRAAGFAFGMVTNGFQLDARAADRLVAHRISSITISLDGLEKNHDRLRGKKGSFQRALAALRLSAERPIRLFDVVTCVYPANLKELPDLLALLQKVGVRKWRLFNIFPKGRAATNKELLLSDEEIAEMLRWIQKQRILLRGTDFQLEFCCEGYLPKSLDRAVRDEPYFCRAGISIGSVLADGAVSACPNITRELVQGNIRTDDFFEVWENRFQPFRDRNWMKTGDCADCKERRRCKGNSMHLWNHEKKRTERCYLAIARKCGLPTR